MIPPHQQHPWIPLELQDIIATIQHIDIVSDNAVRSAQSSTEDHYRYTSLDSSKHSSASSTVSRKHCLTISPVKRRNRLQCSRMSAVKSELLACRWGTGLAKMNTESALTINMPETANVPSMIALTNNMIALRQFIPTPIFPQLEKPDKIQSYIVDVRPNDSPVKPLRQNCLHKDLPVKPLRRTSVKKDIQPSVPRRRSSDRENTAAVISYILQEVNINCVKTNGEESDDEASFDTEPVVIDDESSISVNSSHDVIGNQVAVNDDGDDTNGKIGTVKADN